MNQPDSKPSTVRKPIDTALRSARAASRIASAEYLTITDAAAFAHLSRSTIYSLIEAGKLKVFSPTEGTRRVSKAALVAVIEGQ
jgi:excisionase family DNA binding protein